jgi:hypothetical protein
MDMHQRMHDHQASLGRGLKGDALGDLIYYC